MRQVVSVVVLVLSLAFAACDSGSSDTSGTLPDAGISFPGPDVGSSVPDVVVTTSDTSSVDVPAVGDVAPRPDVSGCDECPDDHPVCAEGACACTEESCGAGRWCQHSACVYCTDDEHCTEDCIDCTQFGRVCTGDGSGCIECGEGVECEAGYTCEDGACLPCNIGIRCGAECLPCEASTPDCVAGACFCSDGSCPDGEWCANGACTACDSDTRCGDACVDCTQTGTPVCNDGACRCTADLQCGAASWCDGGACVACATDDPLHCGESCAVCAGATSVCAGGYCVCSSDDDCPLGYWCGDEGCLPCDTSERCGDECLACPAERATCFEGGCVDCVVDGDCGAGSWCDAGSCTLCPDDDPLHCGGACATCEGATPSCSGGQCECQGDSCGDGRRCLEGDCLLCNEDAWCGASCGACAAPAPYCLPDGTACVACHDESHCGAEEGCINNQCVPDCLAEGCHSDTSGSREDCDSPWIVGRTDAANGLGWEGDTQGAGDDDNLPSQFSGQWSSCWDAQHDQFYRIYLLTGERLDVTMTNLASSFDASLKLYDGTRCDRDDYDHVLECTNDGGNGGDEDFSLTASHDGWYTIVVDGRSGFADEGDWGAYRLDFSLTCARTHCCCYD